MEYDAEAMAAGYAQGVEVTEARSIKRIGALKQMLSFWKCEYSDLLDGREHSESAKTQLRMETSEYLKKLVLEQTRLDALPGDEGER